MNASKWTLWLTFVFTVPVPFFMVEVGWVPTARLLMFAGMTLVAAIAEPDWVSWSIAGFFVVQALAFAAILYAVAAGLARLAARLVPRHLHFACLAAVVAGCFAASLFHIYRTPLSGSSARSNLFGIFR